MTTPQGGYNAERCLGVITAIEADRHEIRELRRKANESIASKVGELRQSIGAKMKEAKSAWAIPTEVLKAQLKIREHQRKANEAVEALDEDDAESLDDFRLALGDAADLPLMAAAVQAKEEDLRSPAQKKRTARADRKAQANDALDGVASNGAETLAEGIQPLRH